MAGVPKEYSGAVNPADILGSCSEAGGNAKRRNQRLAMCAKGKNAGKAECQFANCAKFRNHKNPRCKDPDCDDAANADGEDT